MLRWFFVAVLGLMCAGVFLLIPEPAPLDTGVESASIAPSGATPAVPLPTLRERILASDKSSGPERSERSLLDNDPRGAPGSLVLGLEDLSEQEIGFFQEHPPDEKSILIRGTDGKLGSLQLIYRNENGIIVPLRVEERNREAVETYASLLTECEMLREAVLDEIVISRDGDLFPTYEDAVAYARENLSKDGGRHAHFAVKPTPDDQYLVIDSRRLDRDPELAQVKEAAQDMRSWLCLDGPSDFSLAWFRTAPQ